MTWYACCRVKLFLPWRDDTGDSSGTTLDSPVLLCYLKLRLAMEDELRLEMKNPAELRRVGSVRMEGSGEYATGSSIGVVAGLLGVTEQTLRLYESRELVKPARQSGGGRPVWQGDLVG